MGERVCGTRYYTPYWYQVDLVCELRAQAVLVTRSIDVAGSSVVLLYGIDNRLECVPGI